MTKNKSLYNNVIIENSVDDSFVIKVDGQIFETPNGEIVMGGVQLIKAVAEELQTQNIELSFQNMPLTRYIFTVCDRVRPRRGSVINDIVRYTETDLLCYRVSSPLELVKRQQELWQPLLDWGKDKCEVELIISTEIVSILQNQKSLENVRQILKSMDNFCLTAMYKCVTLSGSVIVGLAILEEQLTTEKAWKIATLEESWQLERWGHDSELFERLTVLKKEFADLGHFLSLIKP